MKNEKPVSIEEKTKALNCCREYVSEYLVWREMAREVVMLNLAPRIYKLGQQFYAGCGFHYSLEQKLGHLINSLAIVRGTITGNDYERIGDIIGDMMNQEVTFDMLCEDVIEAEENIQIFLTMPTRNDRVFA